jgi:ADP-ribose pyrophosphatase YjhB (NUDIX family)
MSFCRVGRGASALYVEGEIRPEMRGGFMSDAAYAEALDNMIIVCSDVVIVDGSRELFYLAKRAQKPMAGIWWIGGRRQKGETARESMVRAFRRETGLLLHPDRFEFVMMVEYLWQDREQEPQECGSQNLAHQFMVELTAEERTRAVQGLERQEYDHVFGLQPYDRDRLISEAVHPVILDTYDKVFR